MIRFTWHGQYRIVQRVVLLIGSMTNIAIELAITQCVIMMEKIVKVMVFSIAVTMGTHGYTH